MEGKITQIEEELTGVKAHIKECPAKQVLENFAKEGIRLEEQRIKIIKKKTEKETIAKYKIERFEITKLLLVAIIAPMMTAFAVAIGLYNLNGVWTWQPVLVAVQITIIPDIVIWLRARFNKRDIERERQMNKIKEEYNEKEKLLTQEVHAQKINAEVRKNEIFLINKEIIRLREKLND